MKWLLSKVKEFIKTEKYFLAVLSISAVTYFRWISFKIFTYGDWQYSLLPAQIDKIQVTSWDTRNFGAQNDFLWRGPYDVLQGIFGTLGIPVNFSDKFLVLWPIIFLFPLAIYLLARKLNFSKSASSIAAILFSINSYYLSIARQGHVLLNLAEIFGVLALINYIECSKKLSIKYSILTGVSLLMAGACDFRVAYMSVFLIVVYFFFDLVLSGLFFIKKILLSLLAGTIFVVTNLYWLLPKINSASLLDNSLLDRSLFGASFANILFSINLFHPFWSESGIVWFNVQRVPIWFWLIPMSAVSGYLLNKQKKIITYFAIIALLGILLAKQSAEPFTHLYQFLYDHLPGFNAFREASKFYFYIALGYSVLVGSLIDGIKRASLVIKKKNLLQIFCIVIISFVFIFNLKPLISGNAGGLYVSRDIPEDYLIYEKFLADQVGYFRTLWVPRDPRWAAYSNLKPKASVVGALPAAWLPFLDNADSSTQFNVVNTLTHIFSKSIIDLSSIKYLIIPLQDKVNDDDFFKFYGGDKDADIRSWYVSQLEKLPFLKKIDVGTKDLSVFENKEYKNHIFSFDVLHLFNAARQLDEKYSFLKNALNNDFAHTINLGSINVSPLTEVADLFEEIKTPEDGNNVSEVKYLNSNKIFKLFAKKDILTYSIKLSHGILNVFTSIKGNLLANGSSTINATKSKISQKKWLGYGKTFFVYSDGLLYELKKQEELDLISSPNTNRLDILSLDENLVLNGSFESGSWQSKVGDCNNVDNNPIISMTLDAISKTDGRQSIQLEATRHTACISTNIKLTGGDDYVLAFDYQSLNAKNAGFYLQLNDKKKTTVHEKIPIGENGWNTYVRKVNIPTDTSGGRLYFYSYSIDDKTNVITRYDNVHFGKLKPVTTITLPKTEGYEKIPVTLKAGENTFEYKDPRYTYKNLFPNPSFETGMWQPNVGDCNRYDENPLISMSTTTQEKTDGQQALELSATRHTACTLTTLPVKSGSAYLVSFDYQSPNAKAANYFIGFNDPEKSSIKDDLPITGKAWQTLSDTITVPKGATSLSLYIYAKETDKKTKIINRYDNFKLIEVPDLRGAFYLVSESTSTFVEPKSITFDLINPTKKQVYIKGATTPFFLGMSESYHDQWQLQVRNAKIQGWLNGWWPFAKPDRVVDAYHYKLDGFLNAWYVDTNELCVKQAKCTQNADGSYNLEMTIEFWPQRWFYLGLLISGTTLVGCLGYLTFDGVRTLRRKRKEKHTTV